MCKNLAAFHSARWSRRGQPKRSSSGSSRRRSSSGRRAAKSTCRGQQREGKYWRRRTSSAGDSKANSQFRATTPTAQSCGHHQQPGLPRLSKAESEEDMASMEKPAKTFPRSPGVPCYPSGSPLSGHLYPCCIQLQENQEETSLTGPGLYQEALTTTLISKTQCCQLTGQPPGSGQ